MTNLMKLSVVALLTGTLALVGCGDDATGTGGTGATGGAGGSGGAGGAACVQTCGVGNETPVGWSEDLGLLNCPIMGLPIDIELNFQGQPQAAIVVDQENVYDLSAQGIFPVAVVDIIALLGGSSDIVSATATVVPGAGTTDINTADIALNDTPCRVCFEQGVANSIQLPQVADMWTLNAPATSQELILQDVVITIDAGLVLTLGTTGDNPDCTWANDTPPTLTFDVGGAGGAGGTGGAGGAGGALQ